MKATLLLLLSTTSATMLSQAGTRDLQNKNSRMMLLRNASIRQAQPQSAKKAGSQKPVMKAQPAGVSEPSLDFTMSLPPLEDMTLSDIGEKLEEKKEDLVSKATQRANDFEGQDGSRVRAFLLQDTEAMVKVDPTQVTNELLSSDDLMKQFVDSNLKQAEEQFEKQKISGKKQSLSDMLKEVEQKASKVDLN